MRKKDNRLGLFESQTKAAYLFIRLSPQAKDLLTKAAYADGRSVSEWVRRAATTAALKGSAE